MASLTFAHLREQNLPRCRRWHPEGAPPWTFDDWLLALGGEVGEALNVVKKLNRDRDGLAGNTRNRAELIWDLAAELADCVIYLDICLGWDGYAVIWGGSSGSVVDFADARRRTGDKGKAESASRLGNRLLHTTGRSLYTAGDGWGLDVFCAIDALAAHFDIDLGAAVRAKFNATSVRFGFPERLAA